VPAPAPLPAYQRQYSGARYPHAEQQQALQSQNYRYQPQDSVVRQHVQAQPARVAPTPSPRVVAQPRGSPQQNLQGSVQPSSPQKTAAKAPAQRASPTAQPQERQPQQAAAQHDRTAPQAQAQDKGHQQQRPQQAAAPHEQKAPKARGEDKDPQQTKGPVQEPRAQQQVQQPLQQAAAQRGQQQVPRAQGQDKGSPGKGSAQEPKQGQDKGRADKGEEQGGERSN